MQGEIKNIIKHGSIYSIGIIISRIISFLMIPVYTNLLVPSEYGILELLTLTIDVISTIVGVGMTAAVGRFYFKYDEESRRNSAVSTALIGTMTLMGISTLACMLSSGFISNLVFPGQDYVGYFKLMFITMFFAGGIEIPLIYIRVKQQSGKFVIVNLVRLAIQLGLNILFLVGFHMGVVGILYSGLITSALIATYLLVSTLRKTRLTFAMNIYRQMLVFGAPLLVSDISLFMLTFGDRFFINYYSDLTSVGIYSLAYKFGMLIGMLFIGPFLQIWSARQFDIARQEDGKIIISKVLTYFMIAALFISFGISALSKDVLRIVSAKAYWSAYKLVPIISMAYVLNGIIYVVGVSILFKEKTKFIAISTVIAMAANILFNFLLIPPWGRVGAAYSTLISYLVRVVLIYYFSQRLFRIDYKWKQIVQVMVIYLALLACSFVLSIHSVLISLLFNILLIILFALVIYSLGILNEREKQLIKSLLRHPLGIKAMFSN
jgi:O-antigen/teichoic acid export membrane protein